MREGVVKMKCYQKPLLILNEEMCEGVYAASGDNPVSTGCQSIYIKGIYRKKKHGNQLSTMLDIGCHGCAYYTGNGCKVYDANAQEGLDARPKWEIAGYKDSDPYVPGF